MNQDLENRFSYHDADDLKSQNIQELREAFIELANLIDQLCPVSREKSLALTNLETASMYANASIARCG